MQVSCYYDYTCPYSYRAFHWLTRLALALPDFTVEWRTFSLKEADREVDTPSAFGDPEISSVSVLALALAHAARDADFARYHAHVFEAMQRRRLSAEDVLAAAAEAGVDIEAFDRERERWVREVVTVHIEATSRWRVFGTPTLILEGETAAFLKLGELPEQEHDEEVWRALCVLARCHPELLEIKRP